MGRLRAEKYSNAIKTTQKEVADCKRCSECVFHEDLREHIKSCHQGEVELVLQSVRPTRRHKIKDPEAWAAGMLARYSLDLPSKRKYQK